MAKTIEKKDFYAPAMLLVGLVIVILWFGGREVVQQFDTSAKLRQEHVVENGFTQRIREVEHFAIPQLVWDEAVRHLDNHYDPGWAADNVGTYLTSASGFDRSFVLNPENQVIFASDEGVVRPVSDFRPFGKVANGLIARVREAEARRGRLFRRPDHKFIALPIQASALATDRGDVAILTATIVQPDFGTAMLQGSRAPIVITTMTLDDQFLKLFAERYLIDKIVFEPNGHRVDPRHSSIEIGGLGRLVWTAPNLSDDLMMKLGLPATIILLLLVGLSLMQIRRTNRMAGILISNEQHIRKLAYFDELTELPNRTSLHNHLRDILSGLQRGKKLAVLCIDLDRFKEVNDTLGHHAGDALLRIAGRRMARQCDSDAFLARISGDEFAIMQQDATIEAAEALARRVCDSVKGWIDTKYGRVFSSCSIGITLIEQGATECAEALRQADLALYDAKQNGRGRHSLFRADMDSDIRLRQSMEHDLREALTNNELTLVYQPQVDRDGNMTSVEALMRWTHPQRGAISPAIFVPLAEECGLIDDLGDFAFRRAFVDSRVWPGLNVAINVSASQLKRRDFLCHIQALVAEYRIDPSQFELELTEGVLLEDNDNVVETLEKLHAMGFGLALDDFGTGYSSLSYLRKFPIDKIKIDKSFIANLGIDREADAVVSAIVKLAQALRLSVIAEGVETVEQRLRLASTGCWHVQGYLYSRPVDADMVAQIPHANPEWAVRAA